MIAWWRQLLEMIQLKAEILPTIVAVLIFFTILLLIEGLYLFLLGGERHLQRRIQQRLQFVADLDQRVNIESLIKSEAQGETLWYKKIIASVSQYFQLGELLLQANISLTPAKFIGISLGLGVLAGLYCWWRYGAMKGVLALGLAGLVLPRFFLNLKKRLRLKKFEKQLPEALGLMARSLKAGHAFPAALQMVSEEMPDPIGLEFFKTFKEHNYGLDLNQALLNLYRRNQLRDLKFFVIAVSIQRETGGNLVEILEKIAYLIRERFKLLNQVKSLTAEGRFSGIILVLMPVVIGFILYGLNPGYISMLWTHPLGQKIFGAAIFLQFLGMLLIKKIVSIKV